MTAAEWLEAVRSQERQGELLAAFDLAEQGLAEHPDDLALKHRAVLVLARAGATEEASRRFEQYELDGVPHEDVAALGARIVKDQALAATGAERRRLAAVAAERYRTVYEQSGGYYPAINAATLWLVAGDMQLGRRGAAVVLELLEYANVESYYAAATEAEAHLILGDQAAATEALVRAAGLHQGDYDAVATTRRQLRLICVLSHVNPQLLNILAGPIVAHFCGHVVAGEHEPGPFALEAEPVVAARIADVVARARIGYAYGSLAGGADILWAEALLKHQCELNVVLPFARDEFIERSVAPCGAGWVERFERCLAAATTVRYATDDAFLGDDVLFRYGSELAMGLALLPARYLDADARQLAVWNGEPPDGAVGTAVDIAAWRRARRDSTVLSPHTGAIQTTTDSPRGRRDSQASRDQHVHRPMRGSAASGAGRRVVRALLFADVAGFSKLHDEQLPIFATSVLGAFAAVLRRHTRDIWHQNAWGDALYVVLSNAAVAASCALDLQTAMTAIDLGALGLPTELALRIGGHIGPVFQARHPVIEVATFIGSHVSRTARIEPVTPPGAVYVTEPFAAALELHGHSEFACEYVGHMRAAKGYGRMRMYRLRLAASVPHLTSTARSAASSDPAVPDRSLPSSERAS